MVARATLSNSCCNGGIFLPLASNIGMLYIGSTYYYQNKYYILFYNITSSYILLIQGKSPYKLTIALLRNKSFMLDEMVLNVALQKFSYFWNSV